jgi:hypothetical protein
MLSQPNKSEKRNKAHLRESTVVPDVPMMREAVTDEAQAALFDVLFDGIEWLLLRDLHLRIGPTRDLNDHVEDTIALVGKKRNIVKR